MKKILLIIAATVTATTLTYAQGQLVFDTSQAGAGAKVLEAVGYSGAGLGLGNTAAGVASGSQFLMQLYAVSGSTSDSSSLVPIGNPVNSRGGTGNNGWSQILGTTSLGWTVDQTIALGYTGTATVQLRAWWAGTTGNTYTSYYAFEDNSATAAFMRSGYSPLLELTLGNPVGNPPTSPALLTGLVGFQLVDVAPIPEPSTFALLGLGALGMLIFRRK